jgi:hypothetical protein
MNFNELKQDAIANDWLHNTLYDYYDSEWANVKFVEINIVSHSTVGGWIEEEIHVIFTKDGITYLAETYFTRNDHGEKDYSVEDIYPVEELKETITVKEWVKV